jgi:hypothetical protein
LILCMVIVVLHLEVLVCWKSLFFSSSLATRWHQLCCRVKSQVCFKLWWLWKGGIPSIGPRNTFAIWKWKVTVDMVFIVAWIIGYWFWKNSTIKLFFSLFWGFLLFLWSDVQKLLELWKMLDHWC